MDLHTLRHKVTTALMQTTLSSSAVDTPEVWINGLCEVVREATTSAPEHSPSLDHASIIRDNGDYQVLELHSKDAEYRDDLGSRSYESIVQPGEISGLGAGEQEW